MYLEKQCLDTHGWPIEIEIPMETPEGYKYVKCYQCHNEEGKLVRIPVKEYMARKLAIQKEQERRHNEWLKEQEMKRAQKRSLSTTISKDKQVEAVSQPEVATTEATINAQQSSDAQANISQPATAEAATQTEAEQTAQAITHSEVAPTVPIEVKVTPQEEQKPTDTTSEATIQEESANAASANIKVESAEAEATIQGEHKMVPPELESTTPSKFEVQEKDGLEPTTETISQQNEVTKHASELHEADEEQKQAKVAKRSKTIEAGVFTMASANDIVNNYLDNDTRVHNLWKSLWWENEICCLFADTNLGKSIYAVQIGVEIAKSEPVVYIDFELSHQQFASRYCHIADDGTKVSYPFPKNFIRATIEPMKCGDDIDYERMVIDSFYDIVHRSGARVVIVDNLTWICMASELGVEAGTLMRSLITLRNELHLSMLIIAHTPKRDESLPISVNDLAGSKRLANFFDSIFTIGKSTKGTEYRYIKQLKCRNGAIEYDENNVLLMYIEKSEDNFLSFHEIGCGCERNELKLSTYDRVKEQVKQLHQEGNTVKQICDQLGVSKSSVYRILQ